MIRLQIDLNDDRVKEIEALMKEGGAATKREFVNAALSLLEWAMKERRSGRIIASIDEEKDSYKEVVMPILSEVFKYPSPPWSV